MIKISKEERKQLINMGCKDYEPGSGFRDICRTYGHHTSYYLRESSRNLELLHKIKYGNTGK